MHIFKTKTSYYYENWRLANKSRLTRGLGKWQKTSRFEDSEPKDGDNSNCQPRGTIKYNDSEPDD